MIRHVGRDNMGKLFTIRLGLLVCLCLFVLVNARAQHVDLQYVSVSLSKKVLPVKVVFAEIEAQTDYSFVYASSVVKEYEKLRLTKRKTSLGAVLLLLQNQLRIQYAVIDRQIILKKTKTTLSATTRNTEALSPKERLTIRGYVRDEHNGEVLINAQVFDRISGKGVLTNNYGFFSISLNRGPVELVAAEQSYQRLIASFSLYNDTIIDFSLPNYALDEVAIIAEEVQDITEETQMSTTRLTAKEIKDVPALLGEIDVIKVIQMLPGVQSGMEGGSGMYVRGGGPDQNLILLDDVPLYSVSHLGGLFSVFNADALSTVKLTKGGFPARYGGRLSSILDIRMKDGNKEKVEVNGSFGLISGKLSVNGPIGKKTTFLVSARRTWIDLIMRPILRATLGEGGSVGYQFNDLNGKFSHTFSDKDRLYLSVYGGDDSFSGSFQDKDGEPRDDFYYRNKYGGKIQWGNRLAAIRWNHIWDPKLFSNLTATYSRFRFDTRSNYDRTVKENGRSQEQSGVFNYQSGVRDFGLKLDFEYYPSPVHNIRFGIGMTRHTFVPGLLAYALNETDSTFVDTSLIEQKNLSWEGALYIEDELRFGNRFSTNIGVHLAYYHTQGASTLSPQLRFASRYQLSSSLALKASFVQMTQFLHLLSNSGIGIPIDLWVPATPRVPEQKSLQVAMGLSANLWDKKFEFTLEGYYKKMNGLIEYQEGSDFFIGSTSSSDWENQVETGGEGWAYGAEVLLHKKTGKTKGWIGYTLSWNNRRFEALNNGQLYPYRFDRRHDISLVISHQLGKRVLFGANWVYGTGNAFTLPSGGFGQVNISRDVGIFRRLFSGVGGFAAYDNNRNSSRMQAYHRMDVSFSFVKHKKNGRKRTWILGIYNAYNRLNPFSYNLSTAFGQYGRGTRAIRKLTLFPIIPSFTYSISY